MNITLDLKFIAFLIFFLAVQFEETFLNDKFGKCH
jgi:protein-S-isoprenylcysteine O-methyltransferase Ste14